MAQFNPVCTLCGVGKLPGEFYYRANRGSYERRCKVCCTKTQVSRGKLYSKNNQLQVKYGLTLESYNLMVKAQNGLCAICKNPEKENKNLAVDHDHSNGKIRQLLCGRCNKGIGLLGDDPDLLLEAASYLQRHKEE